MNNQEAFEAARAGNWIAESFRRPTVADGIGKFYLDGSSKGYSTFDDCLDDGQVVFYAAFDDASNREAGFGIYNSDDQSITPVESTATLANDKYLDGDVSPIAFPNGGTITGTFNAVAFNAIWAHIWDKNNPHEVIAEQVEQDNENNLGDNVQDALDNLSGIIAEWDAAIKATCQNYVSELPPANPKKGDMWTDVGVSGEQYVWEGEYWVSVTGGGLGVDLEDPESLPSDIVRDDVQGRDELYDKKLVRVINSYDGSGHWELAPTGGSGDGSGGSYDDTQIKSDLAKETRERKEADTALGDRIDGLSIPDAYDDTQIRADLNQETEDRIKADASLGVQVGALEQSLTALATSLAFGGSFSAATGTIVEGAKEGIEDGAAIPNAADHHNTFLICVAGGDNPATLVEGDWLVSNDVEWIPVAYASGSGGSVDWLNVENKPDLYTQEESDLRFQEKGDYQPAGDYLTDFTESDPTVPPHVKGITETNISDWDKASTDAGTAISWGNHADAGYAKAEDIDAIGDDSGWELKGESVVYTSNNDSGVYIVDEREEFMFNRANLYMVNQEEMAGGWLGAEYNALQLGVCLGQDPENPQFGVRSPIVTLHKDGMQCAIGSWQKPDSDEKLYVVGDGKFTGTVQATNFLDADGNSIVGGGGGGGVPDGERNNSILYWDGAASQWKSNSNITAEADGEFTAQFISAAGTVQASDFLDAEGNSIIGGGGGGGLPAEFDSAFEYGDPWKGDIEEPGPMWIVQDGGLSASWIHTDNHLSAKTASFHTVKAVTIDTHAPNYGSVSTAAGFFTEATVFGGINITALDQDRPDLPFDLSDEEADAFKAKNRSIQYALTVTHENLGRTVEIDKEGIIRARQFTDMDGNPIGGGAGGGDSIKAEWLGEDGKTYLWWVNYPGLTETKNAYRFFNYETDDPSENNPAASGLIVPSGTSYISSINSHSIIARKIDTTVGPDTDSDYSLITTRRIASTFSNFGESNIYGGINILGADAERPPELPYSPDEKSVQYALTVTHETLGRTVEIDKEGIIRANQFTDMAGNPVSVSPATMVEAFTTLQTAVADEDTLEGVKTALTNALGGLIEKFEGMKNV